MKNAIPNQIHMTLLIHFAVILIAVCITLANVHAQARLDVGIGGYVGSECVRNDPYVLLAGSQAEIGIFVLDNYRTIAYRGLTGLPPANVQLHAWFKDRSSEDPSIGTHVLEELRELLGHKLTKSASDSNVIHMLNPQFVVFFMQLMTDTLAKAGFPPSNQVSNPEYHYLINIPNDAGGKILCVSVALDDPQFGHLEGASCKDIVAPCSEKDRNQRDASFVSYAYQSCRYDAAIQLCDSLLATGWRSKTGLMDAMSAARSVQRYDKALQYLDLCYQTYGTVTSYIGELSPEGRARDYQKARTKIETLRMEQEMKDK